MEMYLFLGCEIIVPQLEKAYDEGTSNAFLRLTNLKLTMTSHD